MCTAFHISKTASYISPECRQIFFTFKLNIHKLEPTNNTQISKIV